MLVVMQMGAEQRQIDRVIARIQELGCEARPALGEERMCIGLLGANVRKINVDELTALSGVERVVPVLKPYKLASRDFHPLDTVININGTEIGGRRVVLMAGPCSVESRAQTMEVAAELHELGVTIMRGGAFKPRTSPYAFQGLGEAALEILAEVREVFGMAIITEVMAPEEVAIVSRYADVLQIGTRNMQNYRLLEAVGRQNRPVLLKRGMSSTVEELLLAAEYILNLGNPQVMLCERGIRTFEQVTRYTFDVNAIPVLKQLTHLPVIADPSHATGRRDLVGPISRSAVAAGADGLLVEVHPHPEEALSDGPQSLRPGDVAELLPSLRMIAGAIGRDM